MKKLAKYLGGMSYASILVWITIFNFIMAVIARFDQLTNDPVPNVVKIVITTLVTFAVGLLVLRLIALWRDRK